MELHSQLGEPVEHLFPRVLDVVTYPIRIGILSPVHEVAIGELDAVFDPGRLLNGASDDGEAAMSHDRVAAENGAHVDDFHPGTTPRRLESGREARDSGTDHDEVGLGFSPTRRRQSDSKKKREVAAFIVASIEGTASMAKNSQDPSMVESCMDSLVLYLETLRVPAPVAAA